MRLVFQVRQQCAYTTSLHLQKGLSVLNFIHQTVLVYLPVALVFFYSISPSCLCQDMIPDKRTLMHVESMSFWDAHTRTRVSFAATLSQLPCALFSEVRKWEEYCFCAWDRPWQWCIELHILSFSLIRMQLPGGEQMAKPSSPPAGCCRHTTGFAVGAAGGPVGLFFLPRPGLALLPSSDCSQRNWPPDNNSLPRHHYQCNKQSKECAKSSSNTDTLCVLRMCQMVSWWHVLIISEVLFVYFFNDLFVHEFYISKCFTDLLFVRISWMLVYSPVRLSRVILNPLYSSFPKAQRDETGGRRVKSK